MGFLKKLKETAEKGIVKGVELGTKGYDSAMDVAKKGIEKAREEQTSESTTSTESMESPHLTESIESQPKETPVSLKEDRKETYSQTIDPEVLMTLKMRLVKGEITKEQFEEMKDMLQEEDKVSINTITHMSESTQTMSKNRQDYLDWLANHPLIKKSKYQEAFQDFEKMIKNNSSDAKAWWGKGISLHMLNRYAEAISAFDTSLSIEPNNSPVLRNKGISLDALGKQNDALITCDRALTIDPSYVAVWNFKAAVLLDQRRLEESFDCYKRATEITPDSYNGWKGQGLVLKDLGRHDESKDCFEKAIIACEKAISNDKDDANAWGTKADSLNELGKTKDAEKAQKQYEKLSGK
ncbi:MAG TPA: tetratricopeptide repeat protein [Nitrosarchaeum sp.]